MCCLFGVLDYSGKLRVRDRYVLTRSLAIASEDRGIDATGIACFDDRKLLIQKAPVRAKKFKFYLPENSHFIMGHTRMTTQGNESFNRNNHPFRGTIGTEPFALAHNGIIRNDKILQKSLRCTDIDTDSYVAVQLLEKLGSLKAVAELLEGTFTLTVLSRSGLDVVRGNNPLCLYHYPKRGLYLYASTEGILTDAISCLSIVNEECEIIPLCQGEILHIGNDGKRSVTTFDDSKLSVWNLGYFRRWIDDDFKEHDEYTQMVVDMAQHEGFTKSDIDLLLSSGHSVFDLEEMIYDTELRSYFIGELTGSAIRV